MVLKVNFWEKVVFYSRGLPTELNNGTNRRKWRIGVQQSMVVAKATVYLYQHMYV